MPLISAYDNDPAIDGRQSDRAMEVRSGVIRGLRKTGLCFLAEMTLPAGKRADVVALDEKGKILIIEIKSSVADFTSDSKWPDYKSFCDRFYFATHQNVPAEIFPDTEGLIIADKHGCEIIREAKEATLSAPVRKALTLRFARHAAARLERFALHQSQPGESMSNTVLAPEFSGKK